MMKRMMGRGRGVVLQPKPKTRHKHVCPECGAAAWGKPGLNLLCGDCNIAFIDVDRDEIERLRRELSAMKWERDELRRKIDDYKRAHSSLLDL
ncbi:sprT domain-containing protein [Trichonephila clavipes]|nr:sprT domain-containing protein [Trichonephila clavipes]